MDTGIVFFDIALPDDDFGSNSLITFGLARVEMIRKKRNKKNMMSLIDAENSSG